MLYPKSRALLPHGTACHPLSLLTKPKGRAGHQQEVGASEREEVGRPIPEPFPVLHSTMGWAASPGAGLGCHRPHQGTCHLGRASRATEPDAQGLTPGLWSPGVSYPRSQKLHKFPFKAKLDLRGLRPVKPEQPHLGGRRRRETRVSLQPCATERGSEMRWGG